MTAVSTIALVQDADRSPPAPAPGIAEAESGRWRNALVFGALFLGAFALRLVGLDWDGQHPDENPAAAARVLSGQLSVSSFYPPLLDYLTAIAFAALYVIGLALSWWSSIDSFRAAFFDSPAIFYITGRIVTATLSAFVAPLTFLLAITHGAGRRGAILAGAVAAFIPGSVFWANVAKSDVALAPAFLFVIVAASLLVERPSDRKRQILLGLAVALAVSVKHSAIFFVGPFLLMTMVSSRYWQPKPVPIDAWITSAVAAALLWIPLNIGIVLDPQAFLDAQAVQTSMSLRRAEFGSSIGATLTALTSADAGIPLYLLLLWLVAVMLIAFFPTGMAKRFRIVMLTFAGATALATAILIYLGGARQPTNLWLPYATLVAVFVIVCASAFIDRSATRMQMIAASFVVTLCFAAFVARLIPIIHQSLLPANGAGVAAAIKSEVRPGSAVLSAIDLARWLPMSPASVTEPHARHERLARKYNVQLPPSQQPLPPERADSYTVMPFPFVFGGLEAIAPDQVKTVIAYAWPLQPEEWRVDYWRGRGYRYVVADAPGRDHPVAAYRAFYRELDASCRTIAQVPATKPLYWEQDMVIYDCLPVA